MPTDFLAQAEDIWLIVAAILYLGCTVLSVIATIRRQNRFTASLTLLGLAVAANTISIALRWERLGHGPYVDLRETLTSGLWGYHLALFLACLYFKRVRPALTPVLVLLQIMVIWTLLASANDSLLPVTYDTYWLTVHIFFGKVFIGCLVVALGLALVVLIRKRGLQGNTPSLFQFASMPSSGSIDELAFRFVLTGFVFETFMLISGAIWAQDAWGRYWDWDPLEVWSFLTWISVALYLHLRITRRPTPEIGAVMVTSIFILAFLTFFGLPFISEAAHKGAV